MKTLVFTTVKLCLWAIVLAQIRHSEAQNLGLIYDKTESVNGLLNGNTSIEDFQKDVSSEIDHASSRNRTPAIFCAIESETLDVFTAQIGQVAQAVHDISMKQILQLVITWTVDITSEQDLFTRLNTSLEIETIAFPNIRFAVILNLHANTKCANLRTTGNSNEKLSLTRLEMFRKLVLAFSLTQNVRVGIGSDFALLNCEVHTLTSLVKETEVKLAMFNMNFGETNGITESLTLFKREVNLWNSKFKGEGFDTCFVIYRPVPGSNVDKEHQSLWNKYSEIVATSIHCCSSFILLKPPMQNNKIGGSQNFQVIPHINTLNYRHKLADKWYYWLPIILEARLKGFDTLLLTHGQWQTINSMGSLEIYTKYSTSAGKPPLKVIVDLSNEKIRCDLTAEECRNSNLTQLEAVLFEIKAYSAQQYKPTINLSFVRNLSSKVTIGCSFREVSFSSTNTTNLVEACKTINGSLYVLKWTTNLEWRDGDGQGDLQYYQNYIKKELYKIKAIREEVQQADPQSAVYFHVYPTKVNKIYYDGKK